jgi:hypothetical protein
LKILKVFESVNVIEDFQRVDCFLVANKLVDWLNGHGSSSILHCSWWQLKRQFQ